jgi:D-cysteine desulfhydrase
MKLKTYTAPNWFLKNELVKRNAKNITLPKHRFEFMVNVPTKIERLELKSSIKNYEIYVKRDDLTHDSLQLQGNKIRKLEFLFADAFVNHQAKNILTAGGLQSNHCRVVACLAQRLNLKPHLFLRSHTQNPNELVTNGNLLIDRLLNANIYLIEKNAQYAQTIEYKMKLLAKMLKDKFDENSYIIPIGGSNTTGLFGYIEQFKEMLEIQQIEKFIDDIVITCGSGGSMAGLVIANYLTGSRFKIHAFCVCDNSAYFYEHIKWQLNEILGVDHQINVYDLVNIIECSKGLGYAKSTKAELEFMMNIFQQTGLLLDPVYTNKTLFTLINLLNKNKGPLSLQYEADPRAKDFSKYLKGNRILFIHTGGQIGVFDQGKFDVILDNKKIHDCFNEKIFNLKL